MLHLGGVEFKTKKAVQDHVRGIMARWGDLVPLQGQDREFMSDLLMNHPNATGKIGCGVASIWLQRNPVYPSTRGFFLRRADGSMTDFSYLECINPTSDEKRFLNACRVAVEPITQAFKADFFRQCNGRARCPYTGERLEPIGSHVHHKPPWTFQVIVEAFMQSKTIRPSLIHVDRCSQDNAYQDRLRDKVLESEWIDFHNARAELEVVSRLANLSTERRNKNDPG